MDLLKRLQDWYARHCDGEWEHHHGVTIQSCDNPGWWVKVDLVGTELEDRSFQPVAVNVDDSDLATANRWLLCRVVNREWHGAGDETKLPEILEAFLTWANASPGI